MDSLVFAGRQFPIDELAKELEGESNVITIGDCKKTGRIMDAVWDAYDAVREIEK